MSEKSIVNRAYARFGKKSLVIMTTLVLLLSTTCFTTISSAKPTKTIRIGVIAEYGTGSDDVYDPYDNAVELYGNMIQPEINAYLASLPKDQKSPMNIEFVIRSADGDPAVHLAKVQEFHEMGIDLVIGGYWSGQAAASLDYMNAHNMLLLSPGSTDPALAIAKDSLFRLVPTDIGLGNPIAATLKQRGITKLVVIYCDNSWAAGVINAVDAAFDGDMTSRVPYPEALDWDTDSVYTEYLTAAEEMLKGNDPTEGILLLSYQAPVILNEASNFPKVYAVEWFGADITAYDVFTKDYAGDAAAHVKLYSSCAAVDPATASSERFQTMADKFYAQFGEIFRFYPACEVDAAWILALCIAKTENMGLPIITSQIANVLPHVAAKYHGYSGYCELNKDGDRPAELYEIWGYDTEGYHLFGSYDSSSSTLTWIG